jgi:GPH family glycoside/pentoside/hexuronide:cation symporter
MAFNIGASLVAPLIFGLVIFPMFPARDPLAYRVIGILCGAISIPPFLIAFWGTEEKEEFQEESPPPIWESMRYVMRNVAFRYTLAIRVLSWMPVVIAQAIFAYFLLYWTGMTEDQASIVQGVILITALPSLPVILWLSRKLEKKTAYIIAAASWAVVMFSILFIPQGAQVPIYAVAALAGFGVAAAHLLPRAMDPDVLEVDEMMSGLRQEGAYTGVAVFVDKLGRSIILALLPLVLSLAGYIQPTPDNPTPPQPTSALTALRILISIFPTALLIASIIVAQRYPITRKRYTRIHRRLLRKRLRRQQTAEIHE